MDQPLMYAFNNEPLVRLTRVMSLNGVLRGLVTTYFKTRAIDPDAYTVIGMSRRDVLAELEREIESCLAQLEALDPLKREG